MSIPETKPTIPTVVVKDDRNIIEKHPIITIVIVLALLALIAGLFFAPTQNKIILGIRDNFIIVLGLLFLFAMVIIVLILVINAVRKEKHRLSAEEVKKIHQKFIKEMTHGQEKPSIGQIQVFSYPIDGKIYWAWHGTGGLHDITFIDASTHEPTVIGYRRGNIDLLMRDKLRDDLERSAFARGVTS